MSNIKWRNQLIADVLNGKSFEFSCSHKFDILTQIALAIWLSHYRTLHYWACYMAIL